MVGHTAILGALAGDGPLYPIRISAEGVLRRRAQGLGGIFCRRPLQIGQKVPTEGVHVVDRISIQKDGLAGRTQELLGGHDVLRQGRPVPLPILLSREVGKAQLVAPLHELDAGGREPPHR